MKEFLAALYASPKVKAAFYALLGAVAVVAANHFGFKFPGL